MYIGLPLKHVSFVRINKAWKVSTHFSRNANIKFQQTLLVGVELFHAEGMKNERTR
jgi:hypothetical protein